MALAETCEVEVRALHAFFEDWFAGERPRTNDELARLERALGGRFHLVDPDGGIHPRSDVIDAVDGQYGSAKADTAPNRIEIEAVEPRFSRGGICLLTYEEHQRTAGEWQGRQSSALFERADDAPGGVVWRHLHETWLSA